MIYLRADQDLEERCRNANAPPWRIWRLRFGLSAKPKHFEMRAGRERSSGSWQPSACQIVLQTQVMETPWGSERVLDPLTARPMAEVQTQHLSCAHPSAWYCPPGVWARDKWAQCQRGPSSLPSHGAASQCQLDFGLSKAFWRRGCSFAFLRILQFFYFITQHSASPIPPYPCQENESCHSHFSMGKQGHNKSQ